MKNYSKELLESLYVGERLSIGQVAVRLGCNFLTVRKYMKKYGITSRSLSEANEKPCDECEIAVLYDSGLSVSAISRQMGIERRRVTSRLKRQQREIRNGSFYRIGEKMPKRDLEWRKNISVAKRGPSNPMWDGGKTEEHKRIRSGFEYKVWRESVFGRDDWTCQKCNRRGSRLHPHHIENFSSCVERRFDVENGVTLCESCNKAFHAEFGCKDNNQEQMALFLQEYREVAA